MPHTVTCHDGDRLLESFEFATEQEAMEYAVVAKRTYDFCPVGSFENEVSVVLKRGQGRPTGSVKPAEEVLEQHTVRMTEGEWEHCQSQGNASQYVRQLIRKDRERNEGRGQGSATREASGI